MSHSQPHIQKLLEDRYYLRDKEGNLLEHDPDQMFMRVAIAVAEAEIGFEDHDWGMKFYLLMRDNKFLPNTPTLINAGKERPGCFSACFVLPVPDSMDGIFEALKQSALIMKAGGGIGYNFGNLREEGAVVSSTGQQSGGPISFMKSFDAMCDTVKQGGSRRGAMMGVLPVWHPDIEKFIECKADGKSFSNFNISIGITDDFMEAVESDYMWPLSSPVDDKEIKVVSARELWKKIVEQAWKTGDPGLIFLDTINRAHPLDEEIEATNPCGEIPLRPYESCNLGSINLMAYLKERPLIASIDLQRTYEFDWDKLAEDIPTMVRFLDDVIDVNPFPLPEIDKASKESRKIGLGIMGWADCLIKMKIPYDSDKAIELAEELGEFIYDRACIASIDLGREKGNFPLAHQAQLFRRNATLLTIAPTGTLSRIAGVSSGIEPIFAWNTHHKLVDLEYDECHWAWNEAESFIKMPWMKTANEIAPEWHLKHQIAFQKYVDNSISKTINLHSNATKEEVADGFMAAWKGGCKGITIYRDGSKDSQPLNKIEETPGTGVKMHGVKAELGQTVELSTYRKRGPMTIGVTHKVNTGRGKIYITINYSEYHQEPVEVFIRLGHAATPTENALAEWTGRLISIALKYGIPAECVIKQGNKVFSDSTFWYNQKSFTSLPQLISYLLGYTFEGSINMAGLDLNCFLDEEDSDGVPLVESVEFCYNCSSYGMIRQGGCLVCQNCGFEKCS